MTSKLIKTITFCGLLFGLVDCSSAAKATEIKINAPQDQKYTLSFNIKESICIKNVEELAKTIGKQGKMLSGEQTISILREIKDEDGECHERPAVLYFTLNANRKAYSCLLSYAYGNKDLTGFTCHEAKSKQKVDKCIAAKLDGKNSAEVNITC